MRTIIDLPEKDIKDLDSIAKRMNVSRANVIRKCVRDFLDRNEISGQAISNDIFGLFNDIYELDTIDKQRSIRKNWRASEDFSEFDNKSELSEFCDYGNLSKNKTIIKP